MEKELYAKKGDILNIAAGEYSDFEYMASFIMKKNIYNTDLEKMVEEAKEKGKEGKILEADGDYYLEEELQPIFTAILSQSGFVNEPPTKELHIGSYGTLEIAW